MNRCIECKVKFQDSKAHRDHHKSQFHKYNLKRKVLKLLPISLAQFQEKMQPKIKPQPQSFHCQKCNKKFASQETYNQHIHSKKHSEKMPTIKSNEIKDIKKISQQKIQNHCLFCKQQLQSLQKNLKHMNINYGFFIARQQFCKDKIGLIRYLYQKINVGILCIKCQNFRYKDFQTGSSLIQHMLAKRHTFMQTDDFDQYQKFYDFTKLHQQNEKLYYEYMNKQSDADSEWEDIDQQEQQQIKQKGKVYKQAKAKLTKNGQLLLPNGKLIGTRKFRYIYKQYYRKILLTNPNVPSLQYYRQNRIINKHLPILMRKDNKREAVKVNKKGLSISLTNNNLMYHFRRQNPK